VLDADNTLPTQPRSFSLAELDVPIAGNKRRVLLRRIVQRYGQDTNLKL